MRLKVIGGWLEVESEDSLVRAISEKLKKISADEKKGAAFKDIIKDKTVRELETLKRPGDPEIIAGGK